jgi:hypothetical protein
MVNITFSSPLTCLNFVILEPHVPLLGTIPRDTNMDMLPTVTEALYKLLALSSVSEFNSRVPSKYFL